MGYDRNDRTWTYIVNVVYVVREEAIVLLESVDFLVKAVNIRQIDH